MARGLVKSPALSLAIKFALNIALIWALNTWLPQYITVFGGLSAFVVIGSLITLLNLFLRPLLAVITLPFKLLFTLVTVIAVNVFFLWIVYEISMKMDPNIIVLGITGGLTGWLVLGLILGIANWILRHVI